jgi:hypothetical protein
MIRLSLWLALVGCGGTGESPAVKDTDIAVDTGASPLDTDDPSADTEEAETDGTDTDERDSDRTTDPEEDSDAASDSDSSLDSGDVDPLDTDVSPDTGPGDWYLPAACDRPVAVDPAEAWVAPDRLRPFQRQAGTGLGPFEWSVDALPSGGMFSTVSGRYISGSRVGVDDRFRLRDLGCEAESLVTVHVVPEFVVPVTRAALDPGAVLEVPVEGGSGSVACVLAAGAAGTVETLRSPAGNACRYTASSSSGSARLTVRDEKSGEYADIAITVAPSTGLQVYGMTRLVPIGVPLAVEPLTGSGSLAIRVESGPALIRSDGTVMMTGAGTAELTVRDRYVVGSSIPMTFRSMVALPMPDQPPYGPPGDASSAYPGAVLPLGDVDGDGDEEVAVGLPRFTGQLSWSGVVGVWSGMAADPDLWIEFDVENGGFGQSLAVGDFDGDGARELAVGAPAVNANGGEVYALPLDVPDPLAAAERVATGVVGDFLGRSLTACDFNGDGFDDLAVGAPGVDSGPAVNIGAVRVFLGSEDGLLSEPLSRLGAFSRGAVPVTGATLGTTLASGDFDGDGVCDLAAGAPAATAAVEGDTTGGDGLVAVYLGSDDPSKPALAADPWRVWMARESQGSAGWGNALAAGDLDRDGIDDLFVGTMALSRDTLSNAGAVRALLSSSSLDDVPAVDGVYDLAVASDLVWRGTTTSEFLGCALAVAEVTNDDQLELVISACGGNREQGELSGVVRMFSADDLLDRLEASPVRPVDVSTVRPRFRNLGPPVPPGTTKYPFFGRALAIQPDSGDDGMPDLVATAVLDTAHGPGMGSVWRVQPAADHVTGAHRFELQPIGFPFSDAGIGGPGTFALSGGGSPMVVVGGPRMFVASAGDVAGQAWTVLDGAASVSSVWKGYPGHNLSDQFGVGIGVIRDFDGDGQEDAVVVARQDSIPAASTLAAAPYLVVAPCAAPAAAGGAGAAYGYAFGADSPSFVAYGASAPLGASAIFVPGNADGTGPDDFWLASSAAGRAERFSGTPLADRSRIQVLCRSAAVVGVNDSQFATSFAPLGDLDGDGCAEGAFGAPAEDGTAAETDRGSVRLVWGSGPACARAEPAVTTIVGSRANARFGSSLAAGDADGDGWLDLGVGAPGMASTDGKVRGAFYLIAGAWLRDPARYRDALVSGGVPTNTGRYYAAGTPLRWGPDIVVGTSTFPASIAIAPEPGSGKAVIWLGSPSSAGGAGRLEGFTYAPATGLSTVPRIVAVPWPGSREGLGGGVVVRGEHVLIGAANADRVLPYGRDVGVVYRSRW